MHLPKGVKAINLGCGICVAPGWINIDNSFNARLAKLPTLRRFLWKARILSEAHYRVPWPKYIVIRDLKNPLPFPDCSIDYAYTSHFLEHNSIEEARRLVQEIYRVLKPGAILRVVVPDLALGARQYLEALRANPDDATAAPGFLRWMQLSRVGARDPHLWMYDAPSLKALLCEAGFVNPSICEYRRGRVPDCDILDVRAEESLYMEVERAR